MVDLINSILPYGILVSNIVLIVVFLAIIFRKSWGKSLIVWIGKRSILLGLVVSLLAVLGSLFYSSVVGYAPCDLCWWQRIFIFPQLILFLTALKLKDNKAFAYSWRLAILGAIVSLYNIYIQNGGDPLVPCSVGVSCTKVYVHTLGYITIPVMALSVSLAYLLLAWIRKIYDNNSYA